MQETNTNIQTSNTPSSESQKVKQSILLTKWVPEVRPYSQDELEANRKHFFDRLGISDKITIHDNCNHFYLVKVNGEKFKELEKNPKSSVGNCSVCWKLRNTPYKLKKYAQNFVDLYSSHYPNGDCERLCYYSSAIERIFYIWLYKEKYRK